MFAEVVGLPPAQRVARLDELVASDSPLRSAVTSLLANLDAAEREGFLADTRPDSDSPNEVFSPPIEYIGCYRVLRKVGEGGSSVVYLAESPPPLYRRVAVKLARTGGSAQSVARAAVEAEALASLNHPGIAQVYETGVLGDGRRWMACEWIEGITAAEAAKNADWRWIVDLLVKAAEALNHAHHHGVIHRDLKPANLLVSGDRTNACIKVIDFGVAKAIEQKPTTDPSCCHGPPSAHHQLDRSSSGWGNHSFRGRTGSRPAHSQLARGQRARGQQGGQHCASTLSFFSSGSVRSARSTMPITSIEGHLHLNGSAS